MRFGILLAIFVALPPSAKALDLNVNGPAVVIDGNTILTRLPISIAGKRDLLIRIAGIDAPALHQNCKTRNTETVSCGLDSARYLQTIIGNQRVSIAGSHLDRGGRIVSTVTLSDGKSAAHQMIKAGMAWASPEAPAALFDLERSVARKRLGLWRMATDRPSEFRKARIRAAISRDSANCLFKARLIKGLPIYVTPWSSSYKDILVDDTKDVACFDNERSAIDAGWLPEVFEKSKLSRILGYALNTDRSNDVRINLAVTNLESLGFSDEIFKREPSIDRRFDFPVSEPVAKQKNAFFRARARAFKIGKTEYGVAVVNGHPFFAYIDRRDEGKGASLFLDKTGNGRFVQDNSAWNLKPPEWLMRTLQ